MSKRKDHPDERAAHAPPHSCSSAATRHVYPPEPRRPQGATRMAKAVKVEPQLESTRGRLDTLRAVLGAVLENEQPTTFSAVPEGKRIQIRRGA